MRGRLRGGLAALLVVMLVGQVLAAGAIAAESPGLDYTDDRTPNPYIHEGTLTVGEHDRGEMDSRTQYFADDGTVTSLPAVTNTSIKHQVGIRYDKIVADAYKKFPRVSGESGNAHNWTTASNWTTSTSDATNVTPTLSDADADGVDKVKFSTSGMAAGDTATATFNERVEVTSDATKRVLFGVVNVDTLPAGANVSLRAVDADGDYKAAYIDDSLSASDQNVVANATGNGYVFQERLSNLATEGTGDGTFGEVDKVEIVVTEADAAVTVAGLDVERKSFLTLGKYATDEDGDKVYTDETAAAFENVTNAGSHNLTTLSTMGSWASSASIKDLEVYDVRYEAAELTDADDWNVTFSAADDYGAYPTKLDTRYRLTVPNAIDLKHGTLELRDYQGFVGERYAKVRFAEATGSTNFSNVSSWTTKTRSYTDADTERTLDATVTAGDNFWIQHVVLLQEGEDDELRKSSSVAGGPTGKSGGFFSTLLGQITGLAVAVVGFLGLRNWFGGGS